MRIPFLEEMSVDCSSIAKRFLECNFKARHHFSELQEVVAGDAQCLYHGGACCKVEKNASILIMGPPCAPFSGARPGRFRDLGSCGHVKKQ